MPDENGFDMDYTELSGHTTTIGVYIFISAGIIILLMLHC